MFAEEKMISSHYFRVVLPISGNQDSDHQFVYTAIERKFPDCVGHSLIRRSDELFLRLDETSPPTDEELASFGEALGAQSISRIARGEFWNNA